MADDAELVPVRASERKAATPRDGDSERRHETLESRPQVQKEADYGAILSARPAAAVQRRAAGHLAGRGERGSQPAQRAAAPNRTGLPDRLKAGVEALSGLSLDAVKVHRNSPKPAELGALAYAQGSDIHLAPGQEAHLPHEAWHVVQQAQGRVRPTQQMKEAASVNDDDGLEREADLMGSKALRAADPTAAGPAMSTDIPSGHGAPVQMKKAIKGTHKFKGKGDLDIDFEERIQGSGAGMYGVVGFMPDKTAKEATTRIELIQIASMRYNDKDKGEAQTSGAPQVKDMWRVKGKFHMDLLGDKSKPRTSTDDPRIEQGYNSERLKWEDPLDAVTMSSTDKVLNQYDVIGAKQKLADTTTRKITQAPGFNKGNGEVGGTELFDFPVSPNPVIASFHTTVDGDRKPWGTVTWGFTSVKNILSDSTEIKSVDGPAFVDEQTEEMKAAKKSFNDIMANSASWTSPEAFDEVLGLLKSKKGKEYEDGKKKLTWMALDLESTIIKIQEASAPYLKEKTSEKEAKQILKDFLKPHVDMLDKVLDQLYRTRQDKTRLYDDLVDLFKKATALIK